MSRLRFILRLILAAVFLYAAYTKLRQDWLLFAMSIDSYQLLPSWAVLSVARVLPGVELVIGILLLTGWKLSWTATVAGVMLGIFFAVMLTSYFRGLGIDCGCFGVGEALTWKTLVRDGALLCFAVVLAVLARLRI